LIGVQFPIPIPTFPLKGKVRTAQGRNEDRRSSAAKFALDLIRVYLRVSAANSFLSSFGVLGVLAVNFENHKEKSRRWAGFEY
jgi:hypothetical protein